MPSQTVTVASKIGLHARPASAIAQAATATGRPVTLALPGRAPVDAGSALLIMTLGAKCGDQVVVSSDDEEALRRVVELVGSELDT